MTKLGITCLALSLLVISSCVSSPYEVLDRGVLVRISSEKAGAPRLVRLEAEAENIVRVSATPDRHFADPNSLVVIHPEKLPAFDVFSSGDTITLKTCRVSAN